MLRITRRAGLCKTYFPTRSTADAKVPMLRGPIGPVGFMRWLCGLSIDSTLCLVCVQWERSGGTVERERRKALRGYNVELQVFSFPNWMSGVRLPSPAPSFPRVSSGQYVGEIWVRLWMGLLLQAQHSARRGLPVHCLHSAQGRQPPGLPLLLPAGTRLPS